MKTIEEQLWNYIDGTCTPAEQDTITRLIEHDETYQAKYHELLALNQEFSTIELDEPSMAFTYNVMETIRTENAMQPLKAAINKRIIMGLAAFFVFIIVALLGITFANVSFSDTGVHSQIPAGFKLPNVSAVFNGQFIKWFLVFDVVLALYLTDTLVRRKKAIKEV